MHRIALAAVLALTACGDPTPAAPDAPLPDAAPDPLLAALQALPGVTAIELVPVNAPPGYRYFGLTIEQPIDHDDAQSATFQQHLTLIEIDPKAPTVQFNTGYWNYWLDYPAEVTGLLRANQIVVEHRFFGDSRPEPADWSKLTIAQDAADQHHVTETFKAVFTGPWIASGGSKGGMVTVFHDRFYPGDLAGIVAYSAPISFANPDYRYDTFVESTLGTQACRDAVKAVAAEMLQHRRATFEARATAEATANAETYTRVAIGPAVEGAIESLYWGFWQAYGNDFCPSVPAVTASDDELWAMLEGGGIWGGAGQGVSPVNMLDDQNLALFEAYYYQAAVQLGQPGTTDSYITPYEMYQPADFDGMMPVGVTVPAYDGGAAMNDVAAWVKASAQHGIWTYGAWDPWYGGAYDITGAQDAIEVVAPMGNHESGITDLATSDEAAALAKLQAWTGVQPVGTFAPRAARAAAPRPPRPSRAWVRLLRARTP